LIDRPVNAKLDEKGAIAQTNSDVQRQEAIAKFCIARLSSKSRSNYATKPATDETVAKH